MTIRAPLFTNITPRGALSVSFIGINLLVTTLAPPAPFFQTDWPNPRAPVRSVDLLTYLDSSEIWMLKDTFFGALGQQPANLDWPVPKGRPPLVNSITQPTPTPLLGKDQFFGAAGQPLANLDWPVPKGRPPLVNSILQATPTPLLGKDKFFGAAGQPPANLDWPVPKGRPSLAHQFDHKTTTAILAVVPPVPFYQTNWPNPHLGAPRSIELLSCLDPSETWLLKDKFFGAAGQPPANLDWPVPKGRVSSAHQYDSRNPLALLSIQQAPFFQSDWPNPLRAGRAVELLGYLDATEIWLFAPPVPFYQSDWPNPQRGAPRSIDLLSWVDPTEVWMLKDTFFGAPDQPPANLDWPVPKGRAPLVHSWTQGLPLGAMSFVLPSPFFQSDWPVPRGATPSIALRSHLQNLKLNLLGQDKFFGPPGVGPKYDYPNPRGKQHFEIKSVWNDSFRLQAAIFFFDDSTGRTYYVSAQGRVYVVDAQNRIQTLTAEDRHLIIDLQNRGLLT